MKWTESEKKGLGSSKVTGDSQSKHYFREISNWCIFPAFFLHLLQLPPRRFHCVGRCWDRTQDCCKFGIGSQTLYSNHSARYHHGYMNTSYKPCKHKKIVSTNALADLLPVTAHPWLIRCKWIVRKPLRRKHQYRFLESSVPRVLSSCYLKWPNPSADFLQGFVPLPRYLHI